MDINKQEIYRKLYEFGGLDLKEIAKQYQLNLFELEAYANNEGWEKAEQPVLADADSVNEFYSLQRRWLSVETAKRAVTTWVNLVQIEDGLLKSLQARIEHLEQNPDADFDGSVTARLVKSFERLYKVRQIYESANTIPTLADKDLRSLLKEFKSLTPEEIENQLKLRGIPMPTDL